MAEENEASEFRDLKVGKDDDVRDSKQTELVLAKR